MKASAPECAMVPRFSISSSRVMPMPVSEIVSVCATGSDSMRIASSASGSSTSRFVSISNCTRCSASDAFEMSSRRKISRSV